MRLLPAEEVEQMAGDIPDEPGKLVPHWFEGPHNADRLDAAVVTVSAGGTTGPHLHIGGQVIVAVGGRGFVEADGERVELGPGDVVTCPPGELHDHGAAGDSHFSHLTITTGGYEFPNR
jgi:quercetin dioxygenase-like cupin family protein